MSFRSLAVLLLGVGVLTAACGRSSRNRTRATETGEGGEPNVGADNAGARSSVSGSASSGGLAGQRFWSLRDVHEALSVREQ